MGYPACCFAIALPYAHLPTAKTLSNRRPLAATYLCRFAAKARFDNRPNPPEGVSKEGEPIFKGNFLFSNGGHWPPPTFAASRQRRDLIIAYPRVGFSKGEGQQPLSIWSFKDGGFSRGKEDRNPSPLEWRFWLLLSLLTKVTRRRQNKKGERKKGEIKIPRFLNCSLVTLFRGKSIPPGAKKGKHFGRMWASAPTNV